MENWFVTSSKNASIDVDHLQVPSEQLLQRPTTARGLFTAAEGQQNRSRQTWHDSHGPCHQYADDIYGTRLFKYHITSHQGSKRNKPHEQETEGWKVTF